MGVDDTSCDLRIFDPNGLGGDSDEQTHLDFARGSRLGGSHERDASNGRKRRISAGCRGAAKGYPPSCTPQYIGFGRAGFAGLYNQRAGRWYRCGSARFPCVP
jgi:hypothetical protein